MDVNSIKIYSDGAMPLLADVYDQLGIGKKIDDVVEWDRERCNLSPGQCVKILVLNMLTDRKPLYRIAEFYKDKDVEKLIGSGVSYEDINEWCLGRMLDKIYEADPRKVYSSVAVTVMDIENIEIKTMHWDTTSKSFQGAYNVLANPEPEQEERQPIEIVRGYSKDMRGDLKQIKFGLAVTKEKIPIFADVLSGNKDDKTWNGDIIKNIAELVSIISLNKIIHVSDSAMVTTENLASMPEEYKFISRLPGTFKLEQELREKAILENNWTDIGKLSDREKSAHYKMQAFTEELEGKEYRFAVCYSDHLDDRKLKTLEAKVQKEQEDLAKQVKKRLIKEGYACEADAKSAIEKFNHEFHPSYHEIAYEIVEQQVLKKRTQRGKPPKGVVKEYETRYSIIYEIKKDEVRIEKKKEDCGMFVLMTNVLDKQELKDQEILEEYKNQNSVESTFRILKDPQYVDEIFLKKPERIEAFGYVMVIAVLLLNTIERRIRKSLEQEETPIQLQGRRVTLTPTGTAVLDVFEYVKVLMIPNSDGVQRMMPEQLTENQKRILRLCGVPENIYLTRINQVPTN